MMETKAKTNEVLLLITISKQFSFFPREQKDDIIDTITRA